MGLISREERVIGKRAPRRGVANARFSMFKDRQMLWRTVHIMELCYGIALN